MNLEYKATLNDEGEKILTILKKRMQCSGTQIRRLKSNDMIFLNGVKTFTNVTVSAGDIISISILEHRINDNVPAQDIPIEVIYEDDFITAVNKPAGMAVHPAGIYTIGTLANALRHYYLKKGIDMTSRPIGRLDRNTSGIVVFAKNSHVMARMADVFQGNETMKIYHGLVHGIPNADAGIIDLPIKRASDSIISRITAKDGKPSKTEYRILERFENTSLIEYRLLTGRTHQIRLHSSEIGCPLIGDGIYGDDTETGHIIDRHALHCRSMSFENPFIGKRIELEAQYPDDFRKALDYLRPR
jgi:23S rRNA pseudouridine1911/1915/1917 synthase